MAPRRNPIRQSRRTPSGNQPPAAATRRRRRHQRLPPSPPSPPPPPPPPPPQSPPAIGRFAAMALPLVAAALPTGSAMPVPHESPAAPHTTTVAEWISSVSAAVNAATGVAAYVHPRAASGPSQNPQAPAVASVPTAPSQILETLSTTARVANYFAKAVEDAAHSRTIVATMRDEADGVLRAILDSRSEAQAVVSKAQKAGNMPAETSDIIHADADAEAAYARLKAAIELLNADAPAS
ncbi:hypothetical protein F503_02169 [Ophiostoma piceae UAMH 11346]|uniref:Uncharacterized protein n=1 Tax=Ophiostoma piceae (strain UAMH 11346) TaxID=1262450 RepID=S3CX62_OPHP1|nr:hypothetical protein F503_02169 [Ophiostoma piceae UAMH 11346]